MSCNEESIYRVNALRLALLPLSWTFALAVAVRNKCYDWGIFRSEALGPPTISIGNLSVGGTGKTPLVAYVARYLQQKAKKVAILSRGYKRRSTGFVLVSDGEKVLVDSMKSGDEAQELARRLSGVIVAVAEERRRAGKGVLARFPIDVFILDDGFQHRMVGRSFDVVTIPFIVPGNAPWLSDFENRCLLPAGRLREPLRNLKRAHHIAFTQARISRSAPDRFERLRKRYKAYTTAESSAVDVKVSGCVRLSDWKEERLEKVFERRVLLFCGIANPERFSQLAMESGFEVGRICVFPDHHDYNEADFASLKNQFRECNAQIFLTTMKDAARLTGSEVGRRFLTENPVYGVEIVVEFIYGKETFHRQLDRLVS